MHKVYKFYAMNFVIRELKLLIAQNNSWEGYVCNEVARAAYRGGLYPSWETMNLKIQYFNFRHLTSVYTDLESILKGYGFSDMVLVVLPIRRQIWKPLPTNTQFNTALF